MEAYPGNKFQTSPNYLKLVPSSVTVGSVYVRKFKLCFAKTSVRSGTFPIPVDLILTSRLGPGDTGGYVRKAWLKPPYKGHAGTFAPQSFLNSLRVNSRSDSVGFYKDPGLAYRQVGIKPLFFPNSTLDIGPVLFHLESFLPCAVGCVC